MTENINIKKKLVFIRGSDIFSYSEGDNFNGIFDIDSITGTLNFDIPYEIKENESKSIFNVRNLQKFDYVFLYYAEINSDREPTNKEWTQVFGGYIEAIRLTKSKDSYSYSITCNGMLGLSKYLHSFTDIATSEQDGLNISNFPRVVLQKGNMQIGINNDFEYTDQKNIIPIEYLDVQLPDGYDEIYINVIKEKNVKDAIIEYKNKYGLIFHENMDGTIQVSSLTNFIQKNSTYEQKAKEPTTELSPIDLGNIFMDNIKKDPTGTLPGVVIIINTIAEKVKWFYNNVVLNSPPVLLANIDLFPNTNESIINIHQEWLMHKLYDGTIYSPFPEIASLTEEEKTLTINGVISFDIEKNVFDVEYPEITSEYDGVLIFGWGDSVGKAIDLTSITLKQIPTINGAYDINTLKLYRRDIADPNTLNKIAREELYKLKQENILTLKTTFLPWLKVGMPFIFNDNDRYKGTELFYVSRISYMISKNDVYMNIEGRNSLLNGLNEKLVTDNLYLLDIDQIGLRDKVSEDTWQNF